MAHGSSGVQSLFSKVQAHALARGDLHLACCCCAAGLRSVASVTAHKPDSDTKCMYTHHEHLAGSVFQTAVAAGGGSRTLRDILRPDRFPFPSGGRSPAQESPFGGRHLSHRPHTHVCISRVTQSVAMPGSVPSRRDVAARSAAYVSLCDSAIICRMCSLTSPTPGTGGTRV